MSKKNETGFLVVTLLVILALVGGVYWLVAKNYDIGIGSSDDQSSTQSSAQTYSRTESFTSVQSIPAGLFSYGGSVAWAPIRKDVDSVIQDAVPQFKLRYAYANQGNPSTATGIAMLLNSQLSFAHSSRPINAGENETARQRGFKLQEIPIAYDGIAIAVNPELDISGLTLTQLKDIYTGKVTNWKEVGGPDFAIAAYSRESKAATTEFFVDNVLQSEKFGNNIQTINTTTEALRKVGRNINGIYYASAAALVGQCGVKTLPIGRTSTQLVPPYQEPLIEASQCPEQRNQVNLEAIRNDQYPLTRRLFVIVKQNGQVDEQAGNAYAKLLLTKQGQDIISQTGFVSIR